MVCVQNGHEKKRTLRKKKRNTSRPMHRGWTNLHQTLVPPSQDEQVHLRVPWQDVAEHGHEGRHGMRPDADTGAGSDESRRTLEARRRGTVVRAARSPARRVAGSPRRAPRSAAPSSRARRPACGSGTRCRRTRSPASVLAPPPGRGSPRSTGPRGPRGCSPARTA